MRPCSSADNYSAIHFNSRTSCEVRPCCSAGFRLPRHFNSRTSCEVRQCVTLSHAAISPFQLTHLLRGATRSSSAFVLAFKFQLTHLLRGATWAEFVREDGENNFNSRTSCEVRLAPENSAEKAINFNSRTSCEVRRLPGQDRWCYGYFNSRTSCEVRRGLVRAGIAADIFQLTHLLRGATGIARCSISASLISTHAPLARCDAVPDYRRRQSGDFNSRTSCEVRPDALISTHAPLARCDTFPNAAYWMIGNFNSRTSCEVRPGWAR